MIWAEPLPRNTFVFAGSDSSTLVISNASVEHTGTYTCQNQDPDDRPVDEDEELNEAVIYVFVAGEE